MSTQPTFDLKNELAGLRNQFQNVASDNLMQKEIRMAQGPSNMRTGISILIFLGIVAFLILNFVGLGYITSVVFDKSEWKDLTDTQKNLARMFAVISWIALVSVLFGLYSAFSKK